MNELDTYFNLEEFIDNLKLVKVNRTSDSKEMIKKIIQIDMTDEHKDVGELSIFKDSYLKKRKAKLKKYTICAFGDTEYELLENLKRVLLNLETMMGLKDVAI